MTNPTLEILTRWFQRCIELDVGELTLAVVDFCCFDWKYSAKEFIVFLATDSSPHQSTLTDFRPPDGLMETSSHSPSKWSNKSLVLVGSSRFRLLCKLRSPEIRGTSLLVSPNCLTRGRRHGGVKSISPSFLPDTLSFLSFVKSCSPKDSPLTFPLSSLLPSSFFCFFFFNEANIFPPLFVSVYFSKLRLLWKVVPFNFLCLVMLDNFSVISLHSVAPSPAIKPLLLEPTPFLLSLSSTFSILLTLSSAGDSTSFMHAPIAMDRRRSDNLIISSARTIWLAGSLLNFSVETPSEALLSKPKLKVGTVRNEP